VLATDSTRWDSIYKRRTNTYRFGTIDYIVTPIRGIILQEPAFRAPLANTVDDIVDDDSLVLLCTSFGILIRAVFNHLSETLVSNVIDAFSRPTAKNIVVSENIVHREFIHGASIFTNQSVLAIL
jgi:hypothetical protein